MPPSLLVNRREVVLGSFLVEYVFPSSVDVRIVLLSRFLGVDVVLEFDNLLYEGSTCYWLVYPGLSSAFVKGRYLSILPWYDVFTGCESAVVCSRWVV